MLTVRFPNGFSLQYNTAGFCKYLVNGNGRALYTKDPDEGGTWVATVPSGCIVEAQCACRTYNAALEPDELGRAALEAVESRQLTGYYAARIKVALQDFDARRQAWK